MDQNRPTLSTLPNELLAMIIEELVDESSKHSGGPSIKACRLVSRQFCDVSSRWLIPSVKVGHSNDSLARLDAISRHPAISRGVRTIEVVLSSYSTFWNPLGGKREFIDFQQKVLANRAKIFEVGKIITMTEKDNAILRKVHEVLRCWLYFQEPKRQPEPGGDLALHQECMDRYFGEFQRLAYEQKVLVDQRAMGTAIAEALSRMPWVAGLRFDDTCHYGRRRRGLSWETPETVVEGIYENTLLPLTRRDLEARGSVIVDEIPFYHHASGPVASPRPLSETIPRVLAAVGGVDQVELKSLVVNVDLIDLRGVFREVSDLREKLTAATRRLTDISIQQKAGYDDRSFWGLCCTSPNLKHYSVVLELGSHALDPLLEGPGSNEERKNLTVIQVKGARMAVSTLKRFLDTIPDVLDRVELVGVEVVGGGWREVLDMLRTKTYRQTGDWPYPVRISQAVSPHPDHELHSTFEWVFQSDATWEPSDADVYVMRQSGVNPFAPEAGKFPLGGIVKW